MTIYDVPVADTVFFPISGDTMRQMKAEEERRDRIIRERLAKHRAEHLIRTLKNGTGSPAKNSPDAADPNHYQEEQTMQDDTAIVPPTPDVYHHPLWCDRKDCVADPSDTRVHYANPYRTHRDADGDFDECDIEVRLTQYHFGNDEEPQDVGVELSIDGRVDYLKLAEVDDLIRSLQCIRDDLRFIGEA